MLLLATLLLIATTVSRNIADDVSPSMRSRPQVKSVTLGSSVEFVCSVANQDEHKVQWWFDNHNRQISSNGDVLTDDTHKYSVWQPKGSSGVWILHISNVSVMDAGHYRCDISSTGLTMTSRLQVTEAVLPFVPRPENIPRVNFTGCCMEMGVAQHCLPICSPPTFNPSSFDMERCDRYMTQLLHCGSDGSNHIPCCRRRHVPTQCLDICLGKLPKEMDESHMVCPRKTLDILACFEEGKLLLPGPPKGLLVRAISPTKLYVKWHAPDKNGDSVIGYYIFYQRGGSTDYRSSGLVLDVLYRIENLDAATAYNLYVVAVNEHGTSLPSYIIHINTPQSRPNRRPPLNLFPDPGYLPECCRQHGVTQDCQPILCSDTPVQDRQHLRRCLPEFNKVLACFAGERNHTDCCVRREVPGVCLPLCGGAPSGVNFQLLSCMRYVSDISSCVREGYNSIPGPPLDVRLGKVTSHEASLEWDPPVYGRAPVKAYLVQCKEQSAVVYAEMTTTETSATLTTLRSSTLYTVKVSSLGHNGTSLPSPSLIFLTYAPSGGVLLSTTTTLIPPITMPPHDIARCCRNQNMEEHCLTLCNYDIDFRAISPEVVGICTRNLHAILQCAVDGRNHTWCCQQRGVHAQCRKFCEFSQHDIDKYQLTDEDGMCVFEMPSLVQCMKEGVGVWVFVHSRVQCLSEQFRVCADS
ncbi:hypothetical protein LSAT2_003909 [Lamellibrachia satsuma]|nr:hypothetical protein LSAT2_003909 [Lamellibrachia satsuma]